MQGLLCIIAISLMSSNRTVCLLTLVVTMLARTLHTWEMYRLLHIALTKKSDCCFNTLQSNDLKENLVDLGPC